MTSLERMSQERARKEAIADWKERKRGSGKAAVLGRQKEEHRLIGQAEYTKARNNGVLIGADVWSCRMASLGASGSRYNLMNALSSFVAAVARERSRFNSWRARKAL